MHRPATLTSRKRTKTFANGAKTLPRNYFVSLEIFADERETTGSVDRSAITQVLPLSEEQRALIFLGVINLPDIPEAMLDAPNPSMPLPSSVQVSR